MEKPVIVNKPVSSLDIIPTIANLMGLDYDSRLYMGQDMFSDNQSLIIFVDRSFHH
jgi:lipoteichoic acid synthase